MSALDGLSRPLRAAGLALIGVALVAAVIGGVTLATGNGEEANQAGQTSESQPTQPGTSPRTTAQQSPTGQPSAPTSTPGTKTSTQPSQPSRPGNGNGENGDGNGDDGNGGRDRPAAAKSVDVRVYNNSNIEGLAQEASAELRAEGWNVVETGNYSQGIIPATTAYYRPGTDEEAAAKALANEFGMRADVRFAGIRNSSAGVIVIVTKDWNAAGTSK